VWFVEQVTGTDPEYAGKWEVSGWCPPPAHTWFAEGIYPTEGAARARAERLTRYGHRGRPGRKGGRAPGVSLYMLVARKPTRPN
jgi:hypothetical protein